MFVITEKDIFTKESYIKLTTNIYQTYNMLYITHREEKFVLSYLPEHISSIVEIIIHQILLFPADYEVNFRNN